MTRSVVIESDGDVALITLDRPDRLNVLTPEWVEDFIAAIDAVGGARAVVLRAAGRAFCAGADLHEHPVFRLDDESERLALVERAYDIVRGLLALTAPVVAAVQGPCAGAGLSVVLACDVRVAADDVRFSLDFVRLGVVPDMGGSCLLPGVVGMSRAMEMALLAEPFGAEAALRMGLVNRVVAAEALWDEAGAIARRIAQMPGGAAAATKRSLLEMQNLPLDQALRREAATVNRLVATPEARAAVAAFGATPRSGEPGRR